MIHKIIQQVYVVYLPYNICTDLFQEIDGPMARAVKVSILRHPWYLSEQLVVLAMFDDGVDADIRAEMATTLHNTPRPIMFPPGKPHFLVAMLQAGTATLPQLIGSNS